MKNHTNHVNSIFNLNTDALKYVLISIFPQNGFIYFCGLNKNLILLNDFVVWQYLHTTQWHILFSWTFQFVVDLHQSNQWKPKGTIINSQVQFDKVMYTYWSTTFD